jgi:hypothetical protein
VEGFRPTPVAAPIVVWHRGPASNGESDRPARWKLLAAGPFEERTIEGGHYDLLYPPLVVRLAAEVDEILGRAELSSTPVRSAPVAAAYHEASARNR